VLPLLIALVVVILVLVLVIARIIGRWQTERRTLTFGEFEPVHRAEIDVGAGPVSVAGGGGPVRVERTMRWLGTRPVTSERVVEGVLRIEALRNRRSPLRGEVGYRVELPPTASVQVLAGAGEVAIQGTSGDVEVRTRAGRVVVADLGGNLRASSQAGTMDGTGLACEQVEASSDAGSITLAFDRPPNSVEARTGAGGIELLVPEERYRIDASSSTGRVEVGLPSDQGAPRRLSAHSDAGAVLILHR
jgi:hypothetical protein